MEPASHSLASAEASICRLGFALRLFQCYAGTKATDDRIQRRYLTEAALRHPAIGPVMAAADDVTNCLQPIQWRSWDMNSMDTRFFGGLLAQTPGKWFLPLDQITEDSVRAMNARHPAMIPVCCGL